MSFNKPPPKSFLPRPENPPELKVDYSIDYEHWLKRDVWKIGAAASILENTDPIKLRSRLEVDFEFKQKFDKTLNIIIWAEGRSLEVEEKSIWNSNKKSFEHGLVKPAILIQWAVSKGFNISTPFKILLDAVDTPSGESFNSEIKNIIELRVEKIAKAAKKQFDNPLKIPYGGKAQLRKKLCGQMATLFTKSTFDAAWKKAKKENLVEVENVDQYKNGM